jgi:hypothetical protein
MLWCERGGMEGVWGVVRCGTARAPFFRCGEGSGRRGDDSWWCALKGATYGIHFRHEEGGNDGGRGGEVVGAAFAMGGRRSRRGGSSGVRLRRRPAHERRRVVQGGLGQVGQEAEA